MAQVSVPTRGVWLTVVGAILGSLVVYGLIVFFVAAGWSEGVRRPEAVVLRVVLYVVALGSAVAAAFLAPRPDPAISPEAFMGRSFLALSLAESSAILGLVLVFVRRSSRDFFVLAGIAAAVMLLRIVPSGLAYWRSRESAGSRQAPPIGPS
jgi:hypothetical protein